jgi:hypothetical protein
LLKKIYRIPYDIPDFDAEKPSDEERPEQTLSEPELLGHYFGLLLLPGCDQDPLARAKVIEETQDDEIWSFFVSDFQFRASSGRLLRLKEIESVPPVYCVVDGTERSDWETVRLERSPCMYEVPPKPSGMLENHYDEVWSSFLDENLIFWKENLRMLANERANDYAILIDCTDEMGGYIRFDDKIWLKEKKS